MYSSGIRRVFDLFLRLWISLFVSAPLSFYQWESQSV